MFYIKEEGYLVLTKNDTANLAVFLENVPVSGFNPVCTLTIKKDWDSPTLLTVSGVYTGTEKRIDFKFQGNFDTASTGLYRYDIQVTNTVGEIVDIYTLIQDRIEITREINTN